MNNNNIQEGKNVTNSSSPRGGREGALISGAEALMRSLEHEGVETLFGYPGGAIMPTFDALYDHKETLNHILVRHEQAAVHAAQGYARVLHLLSSSADRWVPLCSEQMPFRRLTL